MKVFIPIDEKTEGVEKRNFRSFGDKVFWKHVVEKWKDHEVYVNTDSPVVWAAAKDMPGVTPMQRETHLLGGDVPTDRIIEDFIAHAAQWGDSPDDEPIIQINIGSPFLPVGVVMGAVSMMGKYNRDSVVSCNVVKSRLWTFEKRGVFVPINHNPKVAEPTYNLPNVYQENEAFYIFTKKSFKKAGNSRVGVDPYFFAVEFPDNLNVETGADWRLFCSLRRQGHE